MKIIKYLITVVILLTTFIGCNTEIQQFQDNEDVDALFQKWDRQDSPGCALGVIKDGELIYKRGYGMADLEHDIPISPTSVFYIGSVSKQFVTFCILLLEEQGRLELDDEIQKFLPDFPRYDQPLTIRHFIHHTSGVRDYLTLWSLAGNDYLDHIDEGAVYEMIKRQTELNFNPGERYLYSNSCYFMLAMIIEKVAGESIKDYAEEYIFNPLGMAQTHFHDDHYHIIKNRAFSYYQENDHFQNLIMRFDLVGSGGVYSTIEDLYKWDQNFYKNKLGKGTSAILEKMHEEGLLNNGESSGYAFALVNGNYRGLKTVSHSGSLAGYRAQLMRFPDQNFSVILLGNISSFNSTEMAEKVAEVFLKEQMGEQPESNESVENDAGTSEATSIGSDPSEYTGTYYCEELDVNYNILTKDNRLYFRVKYNEPRLLKSTNKDVFTVLEGNLKMNFFRDRSNSIFGMTLDAGRVTNLKFLKTGSM